MKKKMTVVFLSIVVMMSLMGCSTYTKFETDKKIVIKTVDSNVARITRAGLYTTEPNVILLRGKLKRRNFQSGSIPGHLDIELINAGGEVFKKAEVKYWQQGGKYSDSTFSIALPVEFSLVSMVRITHYFIGSHSTIMKPSSWKDTNHTNDTRAK